ncbi:protein ras-2 [Aspergillus bombycis]|uniref:Protein ras-2 n=1 Tax=Aspergillus bombycis TaxID=109264 RepID=A0A1F7ZS16_9EURO|nr:protein ras-2 [Aspergillus bombycis]OGM41885.1 protein ras-2 [Aspergillus bombycis]
MSGKMTLYKLVVLGDGGVGKTALTIQLCLNHFVETYDPTIEDSYRKQVVIDQQSCMLEVLDTAGQEEYTALRDQWIRDEVLQPDQNGQRISQFWLPHRRQLSSSPINNPSGPPLPVPVMLVGNKSDKAVERAVSAQEGQALAKDLGCEFVEASAKNCINVEKAFYDVVRMLRQQRQQQQGGRSQDRRPTGLGPMRDRDAGPEYPKSFRTDRGGRHRGSLKCAIL